MSDILLFGIDLAIKNCGICVLYDDGEIALTTIGMTDFSDSAVLIFANTLKELVKDKPVFVDFTFNECAFPGNKKYTALKYFLAGVLKASASECYFISGSELRKIYNLPAKTPKKEVHKLLPEILREQYNEHELDALILAKVSEIIK